MRLSSLSKSPSATTEDALPAEPPVDLILAQQKLQKLGMYAQYSPRSAQILRECIAHELDRAEQILLSRMGHPASAQYYRDILAARCILNPAAH